MDSNIRFEDFEKKVMEKLLEGNDNVLRILHKQFSQVRIKNREFTGVGFFTTFVIPDDVTKLETQKSFQFGDVDGKINEENDVGFILFVKDGVIDFLEGYIYGDEKWPKIIKNYQLVYDSGEERNILKVSTKWK